MYSIRPLSKALVNSILSDRLSDCITLFFFARADSVGNNKYLQPTPGSASHLLEAILQGSALVIIDEIPTSVCSVDDNVHGLAFLEETHHPNLN